MRFSYMTTEEHTQNAIDRSGQGFVILRQDDDGVEVFNPHTGNSYYITIEDDIITSCSCPHFFFRSVNQGVEACKHIIFTSNQLNLYFDKNYNLNG